MAKHGGKRVGSGRRKGSRNRATKLREEAAKVAAAHAAEGGVMPLDFMLTMLRDPKAKKRDKQWAAKEAAPYVHPRLSSVDTKQKGPPVIERVTYVLPAPSKVVALPAPRPKAV